MKSRHEATGLTFSEQVNVDYNLSVNPKTAELFKAEHLVNRCQELYDRLQLFVAPDPNVRARDPNQMEIVGG